MAESPVRPRHRETWSRLGTQTVDSDCKSLYHSGSLRFGRPSLCLDSISAHTGTSLHRRHSDRDMAARSGAATLYMKTGWLSEQRE